MIVILTFVAGFGSGQCSLPGQLWSCSNLESWLWNHWHSWFICLSLCAAKWSSPFPESWKIDLESPREAKCESKPLSRACTDGESAALLPQSSLSRCFTVFTIKSFSSQPGIPLSGRNPTTLSTWTQWTGSTFPSHSSSYWYTQSLLPWPSY